MRTIQPDQAHKDLVTNHRTMLWQTSQGRVSIRKTAGKYVVRLEDYEYGKTTISSFATLPGALVCAENLREFYL